MPVELPKINIERKDGKFLVNGEPRSFKLCWRKTSQWTIKTYLPFGALPRIQIAAPSLKLGNLAIEPLGEHSGIVKVGGVPVKCNRFTLTVKRGRVVAAKLRVFLEFEGAFAIGNVEEEFKIKEQE